ncbi:BAG family molecular chaperone regulator 4-like [Vigna umbellata]|uniref:BAG family molecular chaperone regulator 4-like n=1 Tax=Vigna umbellata TaxID=87088 RepID=UPI001F5FAF41|nr:BAG family molecular chaperone regulator 4-like [Vigna umbellata]
MEWEMRPGGMLVQRRAATEDNGAIYKNVVMMMTITVTHSSSHHDLFLPMNSTFWDVKKLLANKTGLQPEEQQLFFRGEEKYNEETLYVEGVLDKSKLLLLDNTASEEWKIEEIRKHNDMLKAIEAVAEVRAEVDELAERVFVLKVATDGGTRVSDKEFSTCTELLMRQLLKLDGIQAEGEAKLQRKAEVRRVQNFVDTLDALKERNSKPVPTTVKTVSVGTQWEHFDSGMGSLNAPTSSANFTQDWERHD